MTTFHCLFIYFVSVVCPIDWLWFDDSLQETNGHYILTYSSSNGHYVRKYSYVKANL